MLPPPNCGDEILLVSIVWAPCELHHGVSGIARSLRNDEKQAAINRLRRAMKRFALALLFGAGITALPWIVRPLLGDHAAILWLPGFAAISHWFPAGLHSANGGAAKALGCSLNMLIWTAAFLLVSHFVSASTSLPSSREQRHHSQH